MKINKKILLDKTRKINNKSKNIKITNVWGFYRSFKILRFYVFPLFCPPSVVNKNEKLSNSGFCHPGGPLSENQRKRKERQVLRPCQRTKKIWNIVILIPIVFAALGTIPKGLVKRLEALEIVRRAETIQTTLLRTARILRRVLETWGDLLSLKLQWKTISWRWCEKLQWRQ